MRNGSFYRASGLLCWLGLCLTTSAFAQGTPPSTPPQTRAEAIAADRADKVAELWPERQNALVDLANGLVERGFKEGLDSGKGSNGIQFTVGGMRAAQGLSLGGGYRRSDMLREQLDYRGTVRVSGHGGYMFDGDVEFNGLRTERTSLRWYTKYRAFPVH